MRWGRCGKGEKEGMEGGVGAGWGALTENFELFANSPNTLNQHLF